MLERSPLSLERPTGCIALSDGCIFWGYGIGVEGLRAGELCFNTSMTGYQEILTDLSYAGQIITFTFPHIGNVGTNIEDCETSAPAARGLIIREDISRPSNWRSILHLDTWLKSQNLVGVYGVDTRRMTRRIRDSGAPVAAISYSKSGPNPDLLLAEAKQYPGLEGTDLALEVTCQEPYVWTETRWTWSEGHGQQKSPKHHVVAIDFGAKRNILRSLAQLGCKVTVVPANTTANDITKLKPNGIFLSNGPGDPAATGTYAIPVIKELLRQNLPIFGICLGHQLLALALGAKTKKMHLGHRGANHPIKELATGNVEITSQNHGFVVTRESLPPDVIETHNSLFDGSLEGIRLKNRPVFSVQYHPEASPGPHDTHYLFEKFVSSLEGR
ncbi:MAG: glutamine-hydrolyzing carbamoyl-phosphate synthase small subunit [Rhodospirillaceae bacterium]